MSIKAMLRSSLILVGLSFFGMLSFGAPICSSLLNVKDLQMKNEAIDSILSQSLRFPLMPHVAYLDLISLHLLQKRNIPYQLNHSDSLRAYDSLKTAYTYTGLGRELSKEDTDQILLSYIQEVPTLTLEAIEGIGLNIYGADFLAPEEGSLLFRAKLPVYHELYAIASIIRAELRSTEVTRIAADYALLVKNVLPETEAFLELRSDLVGKFYSIITEKLTEEFPHLGEMLPNAHMTKASYIFLQFIGGSIETEEMSNLGLLRATVH